MTILLASLSGKKDIFLERGLQYDFEFEKIH